MRKYFKSFEYGKIHIENGIKLQFCPAIESTIRQQEFESIVIDSVLGYDLKAREARHEASNVRSIDKRTSMREAQNRKCPFVQSTKRTRNRRQFLCARRKRFHLNPLNIRMILSISHCFLREVSVIQPFHRSFSLILPLHVEISFSKII